MMMPATDNSAAVLPPVRGIFQAMVATIVPEAASLDGPGWDEVERMVDLALKDRPADLKRQLRLGLRAIQWLAVLHYGRPFTRLTAVQRARFLGRLENHRLEQVRVGFWGLRTMALLGYYARPQAAREIGYAADPRGWEAQGNRVIGTSGDRSIG